MKNGKRTVAACAMSIAAAYLFTNESRASGLAGAPVVEALASIKERAASFRAANAARTFAAQPAMRGVLRVDGSEGSTMAPARPARWSFDFADAATGRRIVDWESPHGKPMHLVVVSSDLGEFAHFHPTLKADGAFESSVNEPVSDPDSQDAASAVRVPGSYLLFAEIQPRGGTPQLATFDVVATGSRNPLPVEPDPRLPSGEIRRYFTETGRPGEPGSAYQVTLSVHRMPGMLHASFNVQRAMVHGGRTMYMDVTDLEPWLGMPGHAILIGTTGASAAQRKFSHMHAAGHRASAAHEHGGGHGGGGPDMGFSLDGEEVPAPGIYKLWGQFKREGRILTFPFMIEV